MAREKAPKGDRLQLAIKDFGRVVRIRLNRGKAEISKDGKTVTIRYKVASTKNA